MKKTDLLPPTGVDLEIAMWTWLPLTTRHDYGAFRRHATHKHTLKEDVFSRSVACQTVIIHMSRNRSRAQKHMWCVLRCLVGCLQTPPLYCKDSMTSSACAQLDKISGQPVLSPYKREDVATCTARSAVWRNSMYWCFSLTYILTDQGKITE